MTWTHWLDHHIWYWCLLQQVTCMNQRRHLRYQIWQRLEHCIKLGNSQSWTLLIGHIALITFLISKWSRSRLDSTEEWSQSIFVRWKCWVKREREGGWWRRYGRRKWCQDRTSRRVQLQKDTSQRPWTSFKHGVLKSVEHLVKEAPWHGSIWKSHMECIQWAINDRHQLWANE